MGFKAWFFIVSVGFMASVTQAQEDPVTATQNVLLNRRSREAIIKQDGKAKSADDFATKAANGNDEAKEDIYGASSDVFIYLSKVHGGDAQKLQGELMKAIKDPEAFKNSLPPEIQAKIRATANKIESGPKPKP